MFKKGNIVRRVTEGGYDELLRVTENHKDDSSFVYVVNGDDEESYYRSDELELVAESATEHEGNTPQPDPVPVVRTEAEVLEVVSNYFMQAVQHWHAADTGTTLELTVKTNVSAHNDKFTLVYTAAGAARGYAAGQLGESTAYESAQRWVAFGAGIIVLFLALRVAAKVRAPLVCKMPILSRMGNDKNKGVAKPWEMMLAGLAFATGCMTCFGSALVIGMVVYVGMAQSALYGALILLIFSLGMGIPLVIAGVMMAKVLPLLFKMEKMVKWMGVASAMLMTAFGILLISGNYMAFAELVYGLTGSPLAR